MWFSLSDLRQFIQEQQGIPWVQDGTINVEEYVSRFGFGTGTEAGRLRVKNFVDSSEWEVKETMRRAYSDVMARRISIGGFAMPVDVSGSNS